MEGGRLTLGTAGGHHDQLTPTARTGQHELRVVGGPAAGLAVPLTGGRLIIGRSPAAEVYLDDPDVSRGHAAVTVGPHTGWPWSTCTPPTARRSTDRRSVLLLSSCPPAPRSVSAPRRSPSRRRARFPSRCTAAPAATAPSTGHQGSAPTVPRRSHRFSGGADPRDRPAGYPSSRSWRRWYWEWCSPSSSVDRSSCCSPCSRRRSWRRSGFPTGSGAASPGARPDGSTPRPTPPPKRRSPLPCRPRRRTAEIWLRTRPRLTHIATGPGPRLWERRVARRRLRPAAPRSCRPAGPPRGAGRTGRSGAGSTRAAHPSARAWAPGRITSVGGTGSRWTGHHASSGSPDSWSPRRGCCTAHVTWASSCSPRRTAPLNGRGCVGSRT